LGTLLLLLILLGGAKAIFCLIDSSHLSNFDQTAEIFGGMRYDRYTLATAPFLKLPLASCSKFGSLVTLLLLSR
jgi:hypothetical protein